MKAVLFFLLSMFDLLAMETHQLNDIKKKINSHNMKLAHSFIIEKKDMLAVQENIHNGSSALSTAMWLVGGYSFIYEYGLHITVPILLGGVVVKLLSNKHEDDCSLDTSPLCEQLKKNDPHLFLLLNGLSYDQLKDLKKKLGIKRN